MYKGGALPLPYEYSPDDHCVGATLVVARSRILINGRPLPLPLGEVAERSEDGEGRHVKKICQWHIFSVDLSGYVLLRCPKFLCCLTAVA